jgi:hypothetical protein
LSKDSNETESKKNMDYCAILGTEENLGTIVLCLLVFGVESRLVVTNSLLKRASEEFLNLLVFMEQISAQDRLRDDYSQTS